MHLSLFPKFTYDAPLALSYLSSLPFFLFPTCARALDPVSLSHTLCTFYRPDWLEMMLLMIWVCRRTPKREYRWVAWHATKQHKQWGKKKRTQYEHNRNRYRDTTKSYTNCAAPSIAHLARAGPNHDCLILPSSARLFMHVLMNDRIRLLVTYLSPSACFTTAIKETSWAGITARLI